MFKFIPISATVEALTEHRLDRDQNMLWLPSGHQGK
jgi:hypothetical protein